METCDIEDLIGKLELELWQQPTNPTLQTICVPFEENEFGNRLEDFGNRMLQTMREKNGIGLAGPQVGLTKRIFVMRFPDAVPFSSPETKPNYRKDEIIVVNPELELTGVDWVANEGCLSIPGARGLVRRKMNVLMKYRTPLGENQSLLLEHMNGRVAQHEFDHLEGVMFFKHMQERSAAKLLEQWFKYRR